MLLSSFSLVFNIGVEFGLYFLVECVEWGYFLCGIACLRYFWFFAKDKIRTMFVCIVRFQGYIFNSVSKAQLCYTT